MRIFARRLSAPLLAAAGLLLTASPALALDSESQTAVRQLLMHTFDKAEARLQVEPVVVQGEHGIAGWIQGERGGRALLRRDAKGWRIVACGGDGLKNIQTLEDAGLKAGIARALVGQLDKAEAGLTATQRAKLASFDGVQRMDGHGAHAEPQHGNKPR
jgi:hypothetical protein